MDKQRTEAPLPYFDANEQRVLEEIKGAGGSSSERISGRGWERPKEPQRLLPQYIMNYVTASDPLEQHKESSKIVELAIQYPQLPLSLTMAASNVARSLKLETELNDLLQKYQAFKRGEEPMQLTRIQLIISALTIFKRLYDLHGKESATVKL